MIEELYKLRYSYQVERDMYQSYSGAKGIVLTADTALNTGKVQAFNIIIDKLTVTINRLEKGIKL